MIKKQLIISAIIIVLFFYSINIQYTSAQLSYGVNDYLGYSSYGYNPYDNYSSSLYTDPYINISYPGGGLYSGLYGDGPYGSFSYQYSCNSCTSSNYANGMRALEAPPLNPLEGEFYFDTTLMMAFIFDGNDWNEYIGPQGLPCDSINVNNKGNVGIGTMSPSYTLHVVTSSDVNSGSALDLQHTGINGREWILVSASNANTITEGYFGIKDQSDGSWRMVIDHSGNVGIGTTSPNYKLHVNGSAGKPGGGSWADSSDERIKKNVQNLTGALDKISQLQGVTFEWINPEEHGDQYSVQAGLIAQEVEEVFPDWVSETKPMGKDKELVEKGEEVKSLQFPHGFNAYLIEAIKELKEQNKELRQQNKELTRRIEALEDR